MALLDKVNMLITPNAFKAGKGYVVIGESDLAVLRNTSATRRDSSGLLVTEGSNILRINYPVTGAPIILDEEQDTNSSNFSEDFTNAVYSKVGITIATTALNNPRGVNSVNKMILSASISNHFISFSSNKKVVSLFAQANGYSTLVLFYTTHNSYVVFNLTNGTVTTNSGSAVGTIENFGNGYYRCSATSSLATHTTVRAYGVNGTNFSELTVAGNGFDGLNIFGHQTSDILTSYIPALSNASVTRNADLFTVTPPTGTVRITTTFLDNTTQVINTIPALFTLPTGQIRQVMFQNSL